jgi:hypothetical protein
MSRERLRETGLAALFLILATVVFTWPVAAHVGDGLADIWDAKLNAWILHWDFHQIFRDPVHLYDANIFYPDRYALAFSENLLGAAVFAFPLYAAGVSTLAAYNLVFLLGMFLSALAAWVLARDVTGDPLAAVAAGVVFAFCPWRIAQVPHIQFQWGAFLALSLLFLLRYLDGGRFRDAALFSVCFAWNALCNVHYALFSGFLAAIVLLFHALASDWSVFRRRLAGAFGAMAAAGVVVFPVFLPYAFASKLYGMERGTEEIGLFSAFWTSFLATGGQNKLYASLTQRWEKAEGELFPGLAPLALATLGILLARRRAEAPDRRTSSARRRRLARVFDVVMLVGLAAWVVSLSGVGRIGPVKVKDSGRILVVLTVLGLARLAVAFPPGSTFSGLPDFLRRTRIGTRRLLILAIAATGVVIALGTNSPYYRTLVDSFGPVFHVIRAPARGVVLFDLALGVLAAFGVSELTRRRTAGGRVAGVFLALAVIGFEYRAFPLDVSPVGAAPAPVYRWLKTVSLSGGVIEWPLGNWYDQEYEFRSTAHWKPLVNGSSGFSPRDYDDLAAMMARKPIAEDVWPMLARRGGSLLVWHSEARNPETTDAYTDLVKEGLRAGRIRFLRAFPHGDSRDFVFQIASGEPLRLLEPGGEDRTRVEQPFLEAVLHPPLGYIDRPTEGESVESGAWAFGWALADSGVARVMVTADGGIPFAALYGQPHPGAAKAYPRFPDSARPGFGFRIPDLAPGPHELTLTIIARDGGRTTLRRTIEVRSSPPRSPVPTSR